MSELLVDTIKSSDGSEIFQLAKKSASAPSSPADGDVWYDTTNDELKVYSATLSDWRTVEAQVRYNIQYLVVGGGGGCGSGHTGGSSGGGGGAGGMLTSTSYEIKTGTQYNVEIGAGGTKVNANGATGNSGTYSQFGLNIKAFGGGHGGTGAGPQAGGDGGSGGGAGYYALTPGSGTAGQGNDGGDPYNTFPYSGGAGGGKGAVGGDGTVSGGGAGGTGAISTIISSTLATTNSVGEVSGSDVYYAGGGGGGAYNTAARGAAGLGGGGLGANGSNAGGNGTAYTGGGGGGGARNAGGSLISGGSGGAGVIILRIPTASYSGTTTGSPTVDTDGTDTILTYKESGTYVG